MHMTPILVTGGAGYIGSHVCKTLSDAGWLPVAYDNMSDGHDWAVRWGPLELGDVRDLDRLRAVIKTYRPKGIVHLAGLIDATQSLREPERYYDVNVTGTLTVLKAMSEFRVEAMVFSSSAATYGRLERVPVDEAHPCAPITPYGWSKLMAERMIEDIGRATGLRWTNMRYFNAAGADPESLLGEAHGTETHLVPLAIRAALSGTAPFTVFGDEHPTPDGTCIRDFVHVMDLATAHVLALHRLLDGGESSTLNLGTGHGHSVLEVLKCVESIAGTVIPIVVRDARVGDPACLVSDPSLAKTQLQWTPRRSALASIVADAWAWHGRDISGRAVAVN